MADVEKYAFVFVMPLVTWEETGLEAIVEAEGAEPFNKIEGLLCPTAKVSRETLRLWKVRGAWSSHVTFGRAGESAATAESIFEFSKPEVALTVAET